MQRRTSSAVLCLMLAATAWAQESARDSKLIKRFPAADLDKDGILSPEELNALKKTVRKGGGINSPERVAPPRTAPVGTDPASPDKEQKAASRLSRLRAPITSADVAYGPHERNRLDFWKADSQTPAPVLVLIHAGGFTGGDKSFWYTYPLLSHCLEHGISVAAINYRLIRTDQYPAPMHDGARAVQFLRAQATEWNIDPQRIAAAGGSAGACISLWLGMHDDLADPGHADLVARQSTRLSFVVAYDGQTTLDPDDIAHINPRARSHPWFHLLFGASSPSDFEKPGVRERIDDASAIKAVSADDPPVYMNYQMNLTPVPLPAGDQNMHHPHFGVMLKEKMDALGLECVLHHLGQPERPDEDFEFILDHFRRSDPRATTDSPLDSGLTLGKRGRLLLEETFEGNELPVGWTLKAGELSIADGVLRASQGRASGSLGLFSREQPVQDAVIQIDFRFDGASGINVSVNPSPGELRKKGHLYSVMITQSMWNITEHNDKSDPASRSKPLASARASFETGRWYTLIIENKDADVIARIKGIEPLTAASPDFRVQKPGIEFRVSGRNNGAVSFDNLRIWELK